MDSFDSFTTLRNISSRLVGIAERSSIVILFEFNICKTCNKTTSDSSELIVILEPGLNSILQSSTSESKFFRFSFTSDRWIFIVFFLPNRFFRSSGVSTAIIFPLLIMAISSQMYSASVNTWVVKKIVKPSFTFCFKKSSNFLRAEGSNPIVGSSKKLTFRSRGL